jgi:hypothetical protein
MIGELINKFDNMEDNSFKAFKSLFKTSLDYPSDSIVTIGKVLTSDSRELIIGTERLRYHLLPLEKGTKKVDTTLTFIVSDSEGNELYRAVGTKELKELSNRGLRTMRGYESSREGNDVYLMLPKDTPKKSQIIKYKKRKTWVITEGMDGEELLRTTSREEFIEKMGRKYKASYNFMYKKEDNMIYVRLPNT